MIPVEAIFLNSLKYIWENRILFRHINLLALFSDPLRPAALCVVTSWTFLQGMWDQKVIQRSNTSLFRWDLWVCALGLSCVLFSPDQKKWWKVFSPSFWSFTDAVHREIFKCFTAALLAVGYFCVSQPVLLLNTTQSYSSSVVALLEALCKNTHKKK